MPSKAATERLKRHLRPRPRHDASARIATCYAPGDIGHCVPADAATVAATYAGMDLEGGQG